MPKLTILIFFLLTSIAMQSQPPSSFAGEYYLSGVRETASGFKLNEDSTFEFFFSQGALDRMGSGKWKIVNNNIVLNSREKPASDFALVSSKKQPGNSVTIQVKEANTVVLRYVYAAVSAGGKKYTEKLDDEGHLTLPVKSIDSLELLFEFCPEKKSHFTTLNKTHNYFEFRFEPWMMEYFFSNFSLHPTDDGLSGDHPILTEGKYNYQKAEN